MPKLTKRGRGKSLVGWRYSIEIKRLSGNYEPIAYFLHKPDFDDCFKTLERENEGVNFRRMVDGKIEI